MARTPLKRIAPPCRLLPAWVLCVLLLAAGAPHAGAQQDFELGDEGWEQRDPAPEDVEDAASRELLQQVRQAIADEQGRRAHRLIRDWFRTYDRPHPHYVEARYLHGQALEARNRLYRALRHYEQIARAFPESDLYHAALQRQYAIGEKFLDGRLRRILGIPLIPARGDGEELMIRIQERAPGSRLGERASLRLADHYFERQRWSMAAEAYRLFTLNYPRSLARAHAKQRLVQTNLNRYAGPRYDPTGLIEARQQLLEFQQDFPEQAQDFQAEQKLEQIHEDLAAKELQTGRWYERRGEQVGAAYVYQRLIEQYPDTPAQAQARQRLDALDLPVLPLPEPDAQPDAQPDPENGP